MKKYRLLVVLLRTNALARKPAQKLKLTHQSANRFRRPYQVDYIASLQAHSKRRLKPIHQINHSLRKKYISVSRYKYIHQISDKNILSAITEKRAFDINPIPSKRYKDRVRSITANRAFRGMAGLAVLYLSVVDCIGWRIKTL